MDRDLVNDLFSFDLERRSDDFDLLSRDFERLLLLELLLERERRSRDLDLEYDRDLKKIYQQIRFWHYNRISKKKKKKKKKKIIFSF